VWATFTAADGSTIRVDEEPLLVTGADPGLAEALTRVFTEPVTAIEGWFDRLEGQWADREVVRAPGEPKFFDSAVDRAQRELGLRLVERGGWTRDADRGPRGPRSAG
jgi:hypothetical protein